MKFLQAIIVALTVPLILLNLFGVLVAGIWLLIVGDWRLVVEGILVVLVSTWLVTIALLPQMLLGMIMGWFLERGIRIVAIAFAALGILYGLLVVSGWCCVIFIISTRYATEVNYIPLLIWSYGIATGPFLYMMSKESSEESSMGTFVPNFFAELAYLTVLIVAIFAGTSFALLIYIFGGFMFVAFLILLVNAIFLTIDAVPQDNGIDYDLSGNE